jgi:hypothetical protein
VVFLGITLITWLRFSWIWLIALVTVALMMLDVVALLDVFTLLFVSFDGIVVLDVVSLDSMVVFDVTLMMIEEVMFALTVVVFGANAESPVVVDTEVLFATLEFSPWIKRAFGLLNSADFNSDKYRMGTPRR